MDSQKQITVNIINRYPPYVGITGDSAAELALFFCKAGFYVNMICVDAAYSASEAERRSVGTVHKIRAFYNGKNKYFRLLASLLEGFFLIKKSKKIVCDVIICMTDPPLINAWASLLLKHKKWMLWSMDLYPDAFVADKLISANNLFYKIIDRLTMKNIPQYIIALGPVQVEYLRNKYHGRSQFFSLPCGIFNSVQENVKETPGWADDTGKMLLGYCGNLGEAHSLNFLYAVIDNLDVSKFKLILSIYGSKAGKLEKYIQGKKGIELVSFVSRAHLKYIDVHLASLKKEWINICVPSKTVSSVCAGSAFLYYGAEYSDNWVLLKGAGWLISSDEDVNGSVKRFFANFRYEELVYKKLAAQNVAKRLAEEKKSTFEKLVKTIREISIDNSVCFYKR
ncbi:MAG: hypothetical protein LBL79_06600, partial [Prevotella sp.]|nr:hypothetical protein [Prevotella sp.]